MQALGKDLSRRAGACCELCGGKDAPRPELVEGEEAILDAAVLACAPCRERMGRDRVEEGDEDAMRFLETAIWSEVPPVQIAAVRLLRRLAGAGVAWAREADEALWLDEATEARV